MGCPRHLDYAQIHGLRKNGWTVPLLAERFDVSCQAVAYALSQSAEPKPESVALMHEQNLARRREDSIRIMLIDDLALYRESLSRVLALEPGIHIVAQCGSIPEALQMLSFCRAQIVVMHLSSGSERGRTFLQQLRERRLEGRVLMVTSRMNDLDAVELIRKGVGGIFLTQGSPEQFINVIRKIAAGETWLDGPFINVVMRTAAADLVSSRNEFTARELQILRCVVEGLGNKQFGDRLHMSESSVKSSLQRLFQQFSVRSRAQLVRVVLEREIKLP